MKKLLIFIAFYFITSGLLAQAWTQYLPKNRDEASLTFFDYQAAFKQWCLVKGIDNTGYYYVKGEKQKAYGWKQFKRWEIEMNGWYNRETGEFLYDAIYREMERVNRETANTRNLEGNWTPVAYTQEGNGNDGNGRINCMAFHPTNPDVFWIGAAWGGIWKTEDHGATWTPLSDFIQTLGIGSIAIPSNYDISHTIYLGTGDRGYNRDRGVGILKSTDEGLTWQKTGLAYDSPLNLYINRLLFLPGSTTTLFATTDEGIFKSTDGFATWDTLHTGFGMDMEFNPSNPDIIYVSTRGVGKYTMVLMTTNGGATWDTVLREKGSRTELAVSPDEPSWVYAVVADTNEALQGFYKSTDNGQTFMLKLDGSITGNNIVAGDCSGDDHGGQANYDLAISANPLNAETVFVGGVNVWKSSNSGADWSIVTNGYQNCGVPMNVHVDIHWLDYQYLSDNLFVCSDGGIYYSTNNGSTYTNISGGLMINQPYRISCSQQNNDEIIMGQQDNGIVLWHNNSVDFIGDGDGTDVLINPADGNNQFMTNNGEWRGFTTDHWQTYNNMVTPGDVNNGWFKAFAILPPDTVLYAGFDLWKSTEKGFNMVKIWNSPDTVPYTRICVAQSNHKVIFLLNRDHLYRTRNGGTTWTNVSPIPAAKISNIEIKANDDNTVWISAVDWDDNMSVYKSTDCGTNWVDISEGLPDAPWSDIIQNDLQTGYEELYLCGFFGTYLKLGDNPWIPFNNGLPDVTSFDMDIYYDGANSKIRTGTHGRGVWESNLFSTESNMPGIWTGVYGENWQDRRNWAYLEVPSAGTDITIPANCPFYPMLIADNVICKSLTIEEGAELTLNLSTLEITEDMIIRGTFGMVGIVNQLNKLIVRGNISWQEGSVFSSNSFYNNQIELYHDWSFEPGSQNIHLYYVDVFFMGDDYSTLYSNGNNCRFGNLHINKTSGKSVSIASSSTTKLIIYGDLNVSENAILFHNSSMDLDLYGDISANGDLYFMLGRCNLKGVVKTIYLASSSSYLNDVDCQLNPSSTCTLLSDLQVRGNMTVTSGNFNPAGYNLKLNKNLINAGGNLFPGTGRVIFYGTGPQEITGDFSLNTLELAKTGDTLFIATNNTFSCNNYYYTSGILKVEKSSVFTANNMLQNGIFGHFIVKDHAQVNLNKASGGISLNGIIKMSGGNFNVSGGTSSSLWPGSQTAELWISGGTLDFKDQGIFLSDSYAFLEVITGGVIRTSGSFNSDRNDFTPVGGYIELYGPDYVSLSHGIGSSFYDLHINKNSLADKVLSGGRQKKSLPPANQRANRVTIIQNLDIDHHLKVLSGELDINGKTVDIDASLDITGTLTMTNPASVINVNQDVIWRPASSANISAGLITFKSAWNFMDGTNAQLTGSNTVKALGSTGNSDIYHKDEDACFANFMTDKTTFFVFLDVSSAFPMRVNGNFTINPANNVGVVSADLIVNGILQTENSSGIQVNGGSITVNSSVMDGSLNMNDGSIFTGTNVTVNNAMNLTNGGNANITNLILNGTLDINAGSVDVHNNFTQASGGHLILDGGSFILDRVYTGNYFNFSGITDLNGGFFEITYDGIQFGTGATVNFNGVNLRVGGHFRAIQANSFQPANGAVELINTIGANIECSNGNYFNQLIINKTESTSCLLMTPITIQDDLVLQSGELQTLNQTLTINDDLVIESAGKLTAGSGEVYVGGNWNNNRGTSGFIEGTSSVWFTSSQPATVCSETFYNINMDKALPSGQYLTLANGAAINVSNKMTLAAGALLMSNNSTLSVTGELLIKNGAGLNANPSATGVVINCYDNWADYNSVTNGDQGFNCGQSTVFFKGSANQDLISAIGATFYNLTLQKTGNAFLPSDFITVKNNLLLQSGNWSYNKPGLIHTIKGNMTVESGASWADDQGTIIFAGNQVQDLINNTTSPLNFANIQINRTDLLSESGEMDIHSDFTCHNFNMISGYSTVQNQEIACDTSLVIMTDGMLNLYDNVVLKMADDAIIHVNGGTLNISGGPSVQPLITRNISGKYEFLVNNGGTLQAGFAIFEYMGGRGIEIGETGLAGGTFPFYNCTFRNGQAGGYLLLLNNSQDITLNDVGFPSNAGSLAKNVVKSYNTGNVYLPGATGDFAGPLFEFDPYNRVHWPSAGIWDGDYSTNWHDPKNWRYDAQSPDANTDVVIPSGTAYSPNLSAQEVTVKSLKLEPNALLTISKDSLTVTACADIRGTLNLSANYTAFFADSLVWQAGSSAIQADRTTIYISGDMNIRRGSNLELSSGEIRFFGSGESNLVCHDTAQINMLTNYKSAPNSLSLVGDTLARLTINGNFENGPGTLKCPSTQEWVFNGNFKNTDNGHFRCENGSIRLKGLITSTYFRVKPGDYLHNLIIETHDKVNLYTVAGYSDTLRVNGDLVINPHSGGTSGITANNFKIIMRGDWINNVGAAAYTAGTSTVAFWDPVIPQEVHGNTTFYKAEIGTNEGSSLHFYDNNTISSTFMANYPVYVHGTLNASIVNIGNDYSEIHLMDGCNMQISSLIQGGVVYAHGGTLNVTDLSQNYVTGSYIVDNGLVILGQSEVITSHNLYYASITVNNGELRFTGGEGSCTWPGPGGTADLTMTGGLLNLENHYLQINTGNFTENISGGKINVNRNFSCGDGVTSFHPTGGAIEMNGLECEISLPYPICWFWDLNINNGNPDGWSYLVSNLKIKHELNVMSGMFDLNGFTLSVGP